MAKDRFLDDPEPEHGLEIIRRFDSPVLRSVAGAIRELECRRGLSPTERRFVETIEMMAEYDTVSLAAVAAVQK